LIEFLTNCGFWVEAKKCSGRELEEPSLHERLITVADNVDSLLHSDNVEAAFKVLRNFGLVMQGEAGNTLPSKITSVLNRKKFQPNFRIQGPNSATTPLPAVV